MSQEKDDVVLKLPDEQPALRVKPMPSDLNEFGDVFGGWIMSQTDIAGGCCATKRANSRIATVAVTSFTFKEPVYVGDVISFYTKILKIGNTSITIAVDVYAERLLQYNHKIVKVTEAQLVYVALDAQGRKQPIIRPDNPA